MKYFGGATALPAGVQIESEINVSYIDLLMKNQKEIFKRLDRLEKSILMLNQGMQVLAQEIFPEAYENEEEAER